MEAVWIGYVKIKIDLGGSSMKAVRFHAAKDIRVEDVAAPSKKLGSNDVLIKPLVTGICGTDLHEYIAGPIVTPVTPHVYTGVTNPQILGHEFSAVVADTGSAVTNVKAGDRVSIQPLISPRAWAALASPVVGVAWVNWPL
jgi:(R,R)-butanediol dehydrogenase / meso-butanediol dehydrogenase / diacetyl reductase